MKRRVLVQTLAATSSGIAWLAIIGHIAFGTTLGVAVGIDSDPGMAFSTAVALSVLSAAVFLLAEREAR